MEIRLEEKNDDMVLIVAGNGTAKEDRIITKWYNQILEHIDKLSLED